MRGIGDRRVAEHAGAHRRERHVGRLGQVGGRVDDVLGRRLGSGSFGAGNAAGRGGRGGLRERVWRVWRGGRVRRGGRVGLGSIAGCVGVAGRIGRKRDERRARRRRPAEVDHRHALRERAVREQRAHDVPARAPVRRRAPEHAAAFRRLPAHRNDDRLLRPRERHVHEPLALLDFALGLARLECRSEQGGGSGGRERRVDALLVKVVGRRQRARRLEERTVGDAVGRASDVERDEDLLAYGVAGEFA